jgi:hypothetical protein
MTEIHEAVLVRAQPFGWCMDGHHSGCPGTLPATEQPDPARKGTTYTLSASACPCWCHQRSPATLSVSRTN